MEIIVRWDKKIHFWLSVKENYASVPNTTDTLVVGSSSPDVRRNSICSLTSYKTDSFNLTCRSLPDNNNGYRNSLMGNNETKVLNKIGSNYKIQKNQDSVSTGRGRTSSMGTYLNSPSQSALKNKRILLIKRITNNKNKNITNK